MMFRYSLSHVQEGALRGHQRYGDNAYEGKSRHRGGDERHAVKQMRNKKNAIHFLKMLFMFHSLKSVHVSGDNIFFMAI